MMVNTDYLTQRVVGRKSQDNNTCVLSGSSGMRELGMQNGGMADAEEEWWDGGDTTLAAASTELSLVLLAPHVAESGTAGIPAPVHTTNRWWSITVRVVLEFGEEEIEQQLCFVKQ